jgi:tRNA pseudouridine13 synthase
MRGVRLERIGWLADRITADAIAGNRVRITVRDLTRRRCAELDTRRIFLSVPPAAGRSLRFVNYYGEQRFGSARHGRGIAARSLIRGNFGEALRLLVAVPDRKDSRARRSVKLAIAARWGNWKSLARALPPCPERAVVDALAASGGDFSRGFSALPYFIRQMTVEAYQSWLWNEIARRLVAALCEPPLVRSASRFGDLLFPRGTGVPPEVASMVVPLLSPRTRLKSPWKPIVEEVLNDEGISLGDLRVPGFRTPYFGEVERRVVVEAQEFRLGPLERDESATDPTRFKRSVRFFLPRGSYGTVLLRALGSKPYPIPG